MIDPPSEVTIAGAVAFVILIITMMACPVDRGGKFDEEFDEEYEHNTSPWTAGGQRDD